MTDGRRTTQEFWDALADLERPWLEGDVGWSNKPIFSNGHELWDVCLSYFRWTANNPIQAPKHYTHDGVAKVAFVPKMRATTVNGLCAYIGIDKSTLNNWADQDHRDHRADLAPVIERVKNIMFDHKFTAAAAGEMSVALVMRDLEPHERSHLTQELELTNPHNPHETPEEHKAIHIHPDDPDPLGYKGGSTPRPLYSHAQLDAGIAFTDPDEGG